MYCTENGDSCEKIPNYTNEDDCLNAFACELPDGSVDFSLTEDECRLKRASKGIFEKKLTFFLNKK